MAREGRASGKTSFGKRTQAEKNFRDQKKNSPKRENSSDERPRRSSSFSSRTEKPFKRSGFTKSGPDRFSKFKREGESSEKSFGEGSRFERKRPSTRNERPFDAKRGSSSFRKRNEGETNDRFESKSNFRKSGDRFAKFKKDDESPKRFGESSRFNKGEKTFGEKKSRSSSFRKRDEDQSPKRFESKSDFKKSGDRFSKFKKDNESPKRFDDKPSDGKRSFRRKPEGDFNEKPRFTRSAYGEKRGFKKSFRDKEKSSEPKIDHQQKNIEAAAKAESGLIRLNKFMANSGVGSRREADEFIKMGLVTVNGETITEMGHKVKATDDVRYEGRRLKAEPLVYVLLNKPKGFITTTDDPEERNTVMDLVASACKERIYPVGRLDRNTTGLLLLTNDGDLADKLTHPSYNVKKIYKVELDRPLTKNDFQKILDGVYFEEGKAQVDDLAMVSDDGKEIGIELHIGWNRIVRRIFEALGYKVERLDRVVYAGLDKKDLGRGQWRFLKPEEIVRLKHFR
jgi:23S rRNA pseudouridine2605 synthase